MTFEVLCQNINVFSQFVIKPESSVFMHEGDVMICSTFSSRMQRGCLPKRETISDRRVDPVLQTGVQLVLPYKDT